MIRWIILAKGPDCRGDPLSPDIVCRDSEETDRRGDRALSPDIVCWDSEETACRRDNAKCKRLKVKGERRK